MTESITITNTLVAFGLMVDAASVLRAANSPSRIPQFVVTILPSGMRHDATLETFEAHLMGANFWFENVSVPAGHPWSPVFVQTSCGRL